MFLVDEIAVYAAATFPKWFNGSRPESFRPLPGWSKFYVECDLCHEVVLDDRNWKQGHWRSHIVAGDIAPKPNKEE